MQEFLSCNAWKFFINLIKNPHFKKLIKMVADDVGGGRSLFGSSQGKRGL